MLPKGKDGVLYAHSLLTTILGFKLFDIGGTQQKFTDIFDILQKMLTRINIEEESFLIFIQYYRSSSR